MIMKIALAAIAAVAISAPALALQSSPNGQVLTNPEFVDGFDNYGQCQAALARVRNDQRRSGARGGEPYDSMDPGEYNRASRETTRCERLDDDRYYVVFNADGF
jgi:hypothetical protein